MPDLSEQDISVFVEAVTRYFSQLTREAPKVRGAYLATQQGQTPQLEYTGVITITGTFRGRVYVSAPKAMLRHLLVATGETDQSTESLLDTIGEMANTISGNARRYFGEGMVISVPTCVLLGQGDLPPVERSRPYIVSVDWKSYGACVVVDIQSSDARH